MRKGLTAAVFAAIINLSAASASADAVDADAGQAIRQVISDQMAALRDDDYERAFTYASPSIQRVFRDAERFGRMVRDGYPMVRRPSGVRFTALDERAGRIVQTLVITDEGGALHVLDYEMIETERGWEINGVRVRRPSDAGA
jgi:hypothetical protein